MYDVQNSVSPDSALANPFWLCKITKETHNLAHVNVERPDVIYIFEIIYLSELVVGRY